MGESMKTARSPSLSESRMRENRPSGSMSGVRKRMRSAPHLDSTCAVKRCWFFVGVSPTRQLVTPAGSSRSGSGGDETVEAFDGKGSLGDSASKQAVTRVNAEQASKRVMWEPTRLNNGEGRRCVVQVS